MQNTKHLFSHLALQQNNFWPVIRQSNNKDVTLTFCSCDVHFSVFHSCIQTSIFFCLPNSGSKGGVWSYSSCHRARGRAHPGQIASPLQGFSIPITTIWWIDKIFSRLMFLHCWRILHSHAIWRGLSPDLAGIRSPWHDAPYWVLTKTRSLAKLLLDTRSGKKINGADEWSSTGGGRASCEGLRGMLRRRLRS